jgi:NADPH-dependent 2,4-dienoyl-CoA reductase/sulfur reductase-like enzyme
MICSPRELVVIGGGPAGLAAAASARQAGVEDVLLIEREDYLGGILNQCIHHGFGREILGEALTGPEYAQVFINQVQRLGIECWLDTMVTELTADKRLVACGRQGLRYIQAQAVVLSMGCRERTRAAVGIPGGRPAGIYTAGVAQNFINLRNRMPGKRIVILGSGDIGLIMARRLSLEGAEVLAVVEKLPYPGGLPRNVVQCLEDFDIPLYLSHTVVDIWGQQRLEGVSIAKVGPRGGIMPGTRQRLACDTLLLSVGLIPENELSAGAGIGLDETTGGPWVDETGQTDVAGIYACGNVLYVHDVVDQLTIEAQGVGRAAARYIKGVRPRQSLIRVTAGAGIKYVVPQWVRAPGKRRFSLRVDFPKRNRYLVVKSGRGILKEELRRRLNPPELIQLELDIPRLPPGDNIKLELK